jgi:alkylation response protein AidB-like acyl-CoA dehydrogenase
MYLAPEGEELEIANAAADLLAEAMPIDRLHSPGCADMDASLRGTLGEMRWFALALPEDCGGSGLSPVEHVLFFREAGRQCGPVDMLAQVLAAICCTSTTLRERISSGASGVGLLAKDGDAYRLFGSENAEFGLLVTPEEASLHPLADAAAEQRAALDPANSMRFVPALPDATERESGERLWRLGQLGGAAMLVGLGEAALDLIVDYAKVRETFGRPIGTYQAVRHSCANMAVRLEAARAQLWYAAAAFKEGREDVSAHVDAAKHLANEAGMMCVDENIQLHGGIGVAEEHNAHLLLKHAMLLSRLFGGKRALLGNLLNARLAH